MLVLASVIIDGLESFAIKSSSTVFDRMSVWQYFIMLIICALQMISRVEEAIPHQSFIHG